MANIVSPGRSSPNKDTVRAWVPDMNWFLTSASSAPRTSAKIFSMVSRPTSPSP